METDKYKENRKISIGVVSNNECIFYTLWIDSIITCGILIQNSNDVKFISMVDSTGYNRKYNKDFIRAVVNSTPGFIYCFSHPLKEMIFGKSILNPDKRILDPRELFDFWKECFMKRCNHEKKPVDSNKDNSFEDLNRNVCYLYTWSHFDSKNAFPFRSMSDLPNFEDDPITYTKKILDCKNLNDFFLAILYRTEFMKGGLLFSNCIDCTDANFVETNDFESCLKKIDFNKTHHDVNEAIHFLRSSDFSNLVSAKESCEVLKSRFNFQFFDIIENIKIKRIEKEIEKQDVIKIIKTRKIL